jgi:hypothetical protein
LTELPPNAKNYPPVRHRATGDIMSEHRATSSRNARATSSESASMRFRKGRRPWIAYTLAAVAF